jgi:hypothetical protein
MRWACPLVYIIAGCPELFESVRRRAVAQGRNRKCQLFQSNIALALKAGIRLPEKCGLANGRVRRSGPSCGALNGAVQRLSGGGGGVT